MEIKNIKKLNIKTKEKDYEVSFRIDKKSASEVSLESVLDLYYSGTPLDAKIAPQAAFRSLSANNYAWHLITKIAQAINSTKEEVYQQLVKDYGVCAVLSIKAENFESFANDWTQNGLGYLVEIINSDDENVNAFFYKGIHTYNGSEMHKFLEGIIYEAQNLDIEVRTPEEIKKIEENWRQSFK